ncbi:hypothetical protein [Pantoea sp. S18]|uniref:hypothetical protein n=1 Tax=Pantoea sp. S18 TaxID=3019892 RepID=UPI002B1F91D9|nr:hypothetical protein [Pantoea sp. S18]MEA5104473.1 hypothetical protein [Pantoea sp. S18]
MTIYQGKIKYISGEPGTGKGNHIKAQCKLPGRKLVVQPTIKLINEFSRGMIDVKVLHSESFKGDLLSEIHMYLMKPEDCTIFITDKMFYKIDRWRLKGWKIFIDDSLNFCSVLARNKKEDNIEAVYNKLFITGGYIEIDGEGGELDSTYLSFDMCPRENVSEDMLGAWDYYNQLSGYHRRGILAKSLTTESDKIIVWGDYDIPAYADELDITYLANQFEMSCLYRAHADKFQKVEYSKTHWQEDNNKRIVMNYFLAGNQYGLSKNIMRTSEHIPLIQDWILSNVENYYWSKNNDESINFTLNRESQVGVVQRGINTLQHKTSCVFMAAMNPSNVVIPHYDNIWGIQSTDLVNEWTFETLNQYIYRGVIRDYSSTQIMNVYVYDEVTAHTISGATYNYIDIGLVSTQKKGGRPLGSTTRDDDDKVLSRRFASWKNTNKEKLNIRALFEKWCHKQEQYADTKGLDWLDQLARYSGEI